MPHETFKQRHGLSSKPIVMMDFPESARVALIYIINELIEKNYIKRSYIEGEAYCDINIEINRICRKIETASNSIVSSNLMIMDWISIFELIERIYSKLLKEVHEYDSESDRWELTKSIEDVKIHFSEEISTLISEENLGYEFCDGIFIRKGYSKTNQSIRKAGIVLADPILQKARAHYMKAVEYYSNAQNPDYENSIKETICSIESSLEALCSPDINKNFEKGIRTLSGNDIDKIPAPIVESIIKFYGYRNNGNGIAHGISNGLKVSQKESELYLSLAADYITYFYSIFKKYDDEMF